MQAGRRRANKRTIKLDGTCWEKGYIKKDSGSTAQDKQRRAAQQGPNILSRRQASRRRIPPTLSYSNCTAASMDSFTFWPVLALQRTKGTNTTRTGMKRQRKGGLADRDAHAADMRRLVNGWTAGQKCQHGKEGHYMDAKGNNKREQGQEQSAIRGSSSFS